MTPEEQAQFDRDVTVLSDNLPPLWWNLFQKLKKEGFDSQQALTLVVAFIQKPGGG